MAELSTLLLMAEILHHLGWCWNPINNGKNYQPQLVSRISAINGIKTQWGQNSTCFPWVVRGDYHGLCLHKWWKLSGLIINHHSHLWSTSINIPIINFWSTLINIPNFWSTLINIPILDGRFKNSFRNSWKDTPFLQQTHACSGPSPWSQKAQFIVTGSNNGVRCC